jgi:hypothetical protein
MDANERESKGAREFKEFKEFENWGSLTASAVFKQG